MAYSSRHRQGGRPGSARVLAGPSSAETATWISDFAEFLERWQSSIRLGAPEDGPPQFTFRNGDGPRHYLTESDLRYATRIGLLRMSVEDINGVRTLTWRKEGQ